jgi:hypothetical protein
MELIDHLPEQKSIWLYKNIMSEDERKAGLKVMEEMPESLWTQSVCTPYEVAQLREHIPHSIWKSITRYTDIVKPTLEYITGEILKVSYPSLLQMLYNPEVVGVTLDRRTEGMWLGPHNDVPTGDFEGHIGNKKGENYLEITSVYYWNDDFTGGELEFYDPAITERFLAGEPYQEPLYKYKPVAGDLVCFTHDIPEHMITPVESGVRYSSQTFYNRLRNPT